MGGWGLSLIMHALLFAVLVQITWFMSRPLGPDDRGVEVGVVSDEIPAPMEEMSSELALPDQSPEMLSPAPLAAPEPLPMDLPTLAAGASALPPAPLPYVALGGMPEIPLDISGPLAAGLDFGPATSGPLILPDLSPDALAGGGLLPMDNIYDLRTHPVRTRDIGKLGGTPETEAAVQRALVWLSRHQSRDGHWDAVRFMDSYEEGGVRCDGPGGPDHDVGVTGLATLAFLGAGHTHRPARGRNKPSVYASHVSRAIHWLVGQQQPDGYIDGSRMYGHAIATTALAEAYSMTRDPSLQAPIEKAVSLIVKAQNETGGWRYYPTSRDADTSVVGWQVMALKSAAIAQVNAPPSAFRGAARWLDQVRSGTSGGLYGYAGPGPSPSMTAEGLFIDQYIEFDPTSLRARESVAYVLRSKPQEAFPGGDIYFLYYATLVLHQMGGDGWTQWNPALQGTLLASQRLDGPYVGSWDPSRFRGAAGRVYTTALAALCLEVYYRYLPFYVLQSGPK